MNNIDQNLELLQASSSNARGANTTQGQGLSGKVPKADLPSVTSDTGESTSAPTMKQLPRPSSTARGNVAAFLTKLYKMVSDEASNDLIKWSDDGQSFIVLKHVDFANELLPKFFKHNKLPSFVRQLNMYGFHKVPHLQQGVLLPDSSSEQLEFSNPHFQKNQPDLLCLVSRKKASNGNEDKDALTLDLSHILQEVSAIKKHQQAISADLKKIERDHLSLWQESISARERHRCQQETIDKILRFLASVFSGDNKRSIVPNKKPRLAIIEGDQDDTFGGDVSSENSEDHGEYDEIAKTLGVKRKRASTTEQDTSPAPSSTSMSSAPSLNEVTPATLALLADMSQTPPVSSISSSTLASISTSSPETTTSKPKSLNKTEPVTPDTTVSLPDYPTSQPFKFDPSSLKIPAGPLPNEINPAQQDLLRSISMANAREATMTPLPQSFTQTPAGANVVRDIERIAKEMEQLQRSIEALEAHGLDMNDFNFDSDYLNNPEFVSAAYGDLSNISESGIPHQVPIGNENGIMNELIHSNQDDLDFITPAFDHQHLSSEQTMPTPNTVDADSLKAPPTSNLTSFAVSAATSPLSSAYPVSEKLSTAVTKP
ncbi:stress-responsive transcription factor hsf1 [Lobosporangium transversale]|uniref:HSF-type DNA-binding-domain-containing protein n=1 Tax=Lobosporangium transversale TaxID=64571 RepID=A0A1Y2GI42_9FUNG|nr:HSF-type DNA-binding-domain-containing protein [Lobosporangium transversale]KAF9913761.1 stress-responsive transcription factor hsf1 [Lobosporangium transversale]ORZ10347.1 HSF-type DNA-binding-domain-containing protein [Lobosporangium transversale]|eukprot:XP_021879254.1 HSF-type DNA-binding-domain-containing protein [Lobosporangium transversale]